MDPQKREEAERNGRAYEGVDNLLMVLCRRHLCRRPECSRLTEVDKQGVRAEASRIVWALGVVLEDLGCIPDGISKDGVVAEIAQPKIRASGERT